MNKTNWIWLLAVLTLFAPALTHALEPLPPNARPLSAKEKAQLLANAKSGQSLAQEQMGELYYDWAGVTPDYIEAARWFKLAADQGDIRALHYLETISDFTAEHTRLYSVALSGDAKAEYDFGIHQPHGATGLVGDQPTNYWLILAGKQNYVYAQDELGRRYFNDFIDHDWQPALSTTNSQTDLENAILWSEKAANNDDYSAQYFVAQLYGLAGPTQNLDKLRYWLEQAAAQDKYPIDIELLCNLYFTGSIHTHAANYSSYLARIELDGTPNFDKAFQCYQRLTGQYDENIYAYQLGYMYRYGKGTPHNDKKAIEEFTAAEQSVEAKYELSLIYSEGRLLPRNLVLADTFLTQAIRAWAPELLPKPEPPIPPVAFFGTNDPEAEYFDERDKMAHAKTAKVWLKKLKQLERHMSLSQRELAAARSIN